MQYISTIYKRSTYWPISYLSVSVQHIVCIDHLLLLCSVYAIVLLTTPAWKINIIISLKPITISRNYRYGTIIFQSIFSLLLIRSFVLHFFLPLSLFLPSHALPLAHSASVCLISNHSFHRWCSNFHWTRSLRHLIWLASLAHDHNDHDRGNFPNRKI